MQIFTGTVQSISGAKAVIVPDEHPEIVTREYIVPYYWRHEMGNIQIGEKVLCILDDDLHGYILMRCDGEWDYTIRNTLTVEQAVTFNDTLTVQSDVTAQSNVSVSGDVTVQGNISGSGGITATGTITGGSVSLQTHTHNSLAPGTPTSPPTQ